MIIIPPPKSSLQRQREFRERNPGYYGRLHRKRKAQMLAHQAARLAAMAMGLSEAEATAVAGRVVLERVDLMQAIAQAKRPLMLPAPVEPLRLPGVNAIPTRAEFEAMRAKVAVEVPQD